MKVNDVFLPHSGWWPRPLQRPFFNAMHSGVRRASLAWHRRYGKDDVCLHWTAEATQKQVGTYWYCLPQAAQARKAIWEAVDPHRGKRRLALSFPQELIAKSRESDMHLTFTNGSTLQLVGSDNYDSLVGSPPIGVVFSEYALSDPQAWAIIRPILLENGGWAVFNSTVRGRNHFHGLHKMAEQSPDWYASHLGWQDTGRFTAEEIESEFREIAAERGEDDARIIILQEYASDWDAGFPGAYYARHMSEARAQGRIGDFGHDPRYPVVTAWDIGKKDSTAVWFAQIMPNGRIRWIDYLEGSGVDPDWFTKRMHAKPYVYAEHIWPHDAAQVRFGMQQSLQTQAEDLGLRGIRILPVSDIQAGIQAVRALIRQSEFNLHPVPCPVDGETRAKADERMERGLSAMSSYHRKWNDESRRYDDAPHHDWASNPADAARYLAVGKQDWYEHPDRVGPMATEAITEDTQRDARRPLRRYNEFAINDD